MMVAPDASFAVMVTGIVAAAPAGGVAFPSAITTEATTPPSVMSSGAGDAPIVADTVPDPSFEPDAPVPEKSVTAKVSSPCGAVTLMVHVVAPFDVVHPPDDGVMLAVTLGAAPLTAIVTDCAFGDT